MKSRVAGDGDQLLASKDLGPPDDGLAERLGDFVHGVGALDVVGHRPLDGESGSPADAKATSLCVAAFALWPGTAAAAST